MNEIILNLAKAIKEAKKIVFFGGAGVSTESGIPDFRSKDGLYNLKSKYGKPYEEMLSHTYFVKHTSTFFEFYKEFMCKKDAKPNFAHEYLAKLEKQGKNITIITQNIDGLHSKAGSKNVIELHGSIYRNYCLKCGRSYSLDYILNSNDIPYCEKCGGLIKPDVTLYEEPLNEMILTKALIALGEADLLIIAGTSLSVYPANGLIDYFYGDNIFVINKDKINTYKQIKGEINDNIAKVFEEIDSL